MIKSPQMLSVIDPTEGLVQYVLAVKPYHTKILEVLVEYVYTDKVVVIVQDHMVSQDNFSNQLPSLLAAATIADKIFFDIHLYLQDTISATLADIRPVGYGMDGFSSGTDGDMGSNRNPEGLGITVVGTGADDTYTLSPDGMDLEAFDE
jgi:hypothetical protein